MNEEKLMPIHPGEVLLEEFLKPMDLSQEQIASTLIAPKTQRIEDSLALKSVISTPVWRMLFFLI